MGFFSTLFGSSPQVSNAASTSVADEQKKSKKARTALLATEGGIVGQDVTQVSANQRNTLLGN